MEDSQLTEDRVDKVYYTITPPDAGWPKPDAIPEQIKPMLRPIAETLAMLDGNAFFGHVGQDGAEWWEQYLPEAWVVFQDNGGLDGWAGEAQFVKDLMHENADVAEAYESWKMLKRMYHE